MKMIISLLKKLKHLLYKTNMIREKFEQDKIIDCIILQFQKYVSSVLLSELFGGGGGGVDFLDSCS